MPLITISPEVMSGTPVFYATRVPVKTLFDYLKVGDSIDNFLEDFPSVDRNQALQALSMAEHILTLNQGDGVAA